jgi:hypothetical protein
MDAPAPTPPGADVFTRHFRHSRRHRIIVCVGCRTAVVPKHAAAHLARNHNQTTKEERMHVQRYVDGLEDIAHNVSEIRFPGPDDPPYDGIAVRHDGLRCAGEGPDGRRCRYVVSTVRKIKAHCETTHGWRNEQRRGGNVKQKTAQPPNRMWDDGQAYQQFFNKPAWKRNTPVTAPADNGGSGGAGQDVVALADRLLTQREAVSSYPPSRGQLRSWFFARNRPPPRVALKL